MLKQTSYILLIFILILKLSLFLFLFHIKHSTLSISLYSKFSLTSKFTDKFSVLNQVQNNQKISIVTSSDENIN
uniref:Uncharacterized protein n=1 Tax=Tetranychus urticae TaxID=32264 RepID=T1KXI4_TETUR